MEAGKGPSIVKKKAGQKSRVLQLRLEMGKEKARWGMEAGRFASSS